VTMPWTAKQTRYMFANHPDIAKRVTKEPGFKTLPPKKGKPDKKSKKLGVIGHR